MTVASGGTALPPPASCCAPSSHNRMYFGIVPIREGTQKYPEFIYKTLFIYSRMFKLLAPSKDSPLDMIDLSRCFFLLLKTVFELVNFEPFSVSAIFGFTSSA